MARRLETKTAGKRKQRLHRVAFSRGWEGIAVRRVAIGREARRDEMLRHTQHRRVLCHRDILYVAAPGTTLTEALPPGHRTRSLMSGLEPFPRTEGNRERESWKFQYTVELSMGLYHGIEVRHN